MRPAATTSRRRSGRSSAPSPPLPNHEETRASAAATEEAETAAAEAEDVALADLWGAVDPQFKGDEEDEDVTTTLIADAATKYIGYLEKELQETKEELEGVEAGREEAEMKLQEEIETGEERWLNEASRGQ